MEGGKRLEARSQLSVPKSGQSWQSGRHEETNGKDMKDSWIRFVSEKN